MEPTPRKAKRSGCSDGQIAALRPRLVGGGHRAATALTRRATGLQDRADLCRRIRGDNRNHYSSYDEESEVAAREKPAELIFRTVLNRIGQGIESDDPRHAAMELRAAGYETVMVNYSNTEP